MHMHCAYLITTDFLSCRRHLRDAPLLSPRNITLAQHTPPHLLFLHLCFARQANWKRRRKMCCILRGAWWKSLESLVRPCSDYNEIIYLYTSTCCGGPEHIVHLDKVSLGGLQASIVYKTWCCIKLATTAAATLSFIQSTPSQIDHSICQVQVEFVVAAGARV